MAIFIAAPATQAYTITMGILDNGNEGYLSKEGDSEGGTGVVDTEELGGYNIYKISAIAPSTVGVGITGGNKNGTSLRPWGTLTLTVGGVSDVLVVSNINSNMAYFTANLPLYDAVVAAVGVPTAASITTS